jgi:hypothetical protein
MSDYDLPYTFDLWFDLKSRSDLARHYVQLKQQLNTLEQMMADHGIELTVDELSELASDTEISSEAKPL